MSYQPSAADEKQEVSISERGRTGPGWESQGVARLHVNAPVRAVIHIHVRQPVTPDHLHQAMLVDNMTCATCALQLSALSVLTSRICLTLTMAYRLARHSRPACMALPQHGVGCRG